MQVGGDKKLSTVLRYSSDTKWDLISSRIRIEHELCNKVFPWNPVSSPWSRKRTLPPRCLQLASSSASFAILVTAFSFRIIDHIIPFSDPRESVAWSATAIMLDARLTAPSSLLTIGTIAVVLHIEMSVWVLDHEKEIVIVSRNWSSCSQRRFTLPLNPPEVFCNYTRWILMFPSARHSSVFTGVIKTISGQR